MTDVTGPIGRPEWRLVGLGRGDLRGHTRRYSMGLPARQRRVLGRIEGALRGSDPKLAALYSIFARLTREEEMPRIEQLRHRVVVLLASARRRLTIRRRRPSFGWLVPRQRAALLFPLALVLAAGAIVPAGKVGGGAGW